jgi:parallel beta-helix repeat protein
MSFILTVVSNSIQDGRPGVISKSIHCAAFLWICCASTACFAASPNGTTIPPATQIVDSNGAIWTADATGARLCYRNGVQPSGCANVTVLVYYNNVIYVGNTYGTWYQWNGSSWTVIAGDPRGAAWYVDGNNGNDANPGTKAAPFKTPAHGIAKAGPGDTVHFLSTVAYPCFGIFKSGTATQPITLMGDGVAPNLTQVRGNNACFGIQVNLGASYINVMNFDVSTGTGPIVNGQPWYGIFVSYGSHHILVNGNVVHDSWGGGIASAQADYVTISHNTVYNTAQYTADGFFRSGISTYESTDIDSNTGVKMIIDSNVVYSNTNVATPGIHGGTDPDGSGIIIDDSSHSQSNNVPYKGHTLVQNNISYNNGGRGITLSFSSHVIVTNNTCYYNNQDPHEAAWRPGEIMASGIVGGGNDGGSDILIYNNILYSDGAVGGPTAGRHVGISIEDARDGLGSVTADYNLIFNPQSDPSLQFYQIDNTNTVTFGANNRFGNPLFVNASINPAVANFHVNATSPSLGSANWTYIPILDINGTLRPVSGPFDMGAYK